MSRGLLCFGRHVKLLIPAAFAVVSIHNGLTSGRRPFVKIIAESLSQHDEKHIVPTPLSGIRVGEKRLFIVIRSTYLFPLLGYRPLWIRNFLTITNDLSTNDRSRTEATEENDVDCGN
jgi:hypothetical protein